MPQPHEPWTTVLDGTSEASKPIQREYVIETVIGAEDCLFLNVFTKEINPSKLKPVFVWIYGGGFVRGSTSKDVYSPDYFLSKDVVFVSIAYRVGIFGFLSMKDPSLKIPGNAGLKDQILGLKWVQQNISRFGGDTNNVTIFGESAGGASVHFLGLTEKARGLFHQMICMSGSAFCNWALPPPKNWPLRIAKDLGYKGEDNDSAVLHFLRKADCKKIAISEANILTKQEMLEGYLWCSYPVVEPYKSDDCVLPEQPLILARDAWSNDIPVIVGGTSREGIFFANSKPSGAFKEWESNPSLILPFDLKTGRSGEECEDLGRILKEYHFKDGKWTEDTFIDFLSYKLFWHGVHRMVLSRQKYAKAATYLYVFEFDSPKNALLKTLASVKTAGVSHGDDLAYLFLNFLTPETQAGSSERNKIEELIGLWFHFSRNGVPNCDGIGPCTWKPVQSNEKSHGCLRIGHELIFEQNPFANILQFWDDLYDEDKLF